MMKKWMIMLLTACMLCSGICTFAKTGDISGNIYSTDIRAFINQVEVPSYNVGGKTVIIVEDVIGGYGYNYNDAARLLQIFHFKPQGLISGSSASYDTCGQVVGHTYETDIKTTMYKVEIPSYNIGGKTAVALEDLGCDHAFSDLGGRYVWDGTNRTISLEMLYDEWGYCPAILRDYEVDMMVHLNEDQTEGDLTFPHRPMQGGALQYETPIFVPEGEYKSLTIPLYAMNQGIREQVSYIFYRTIPKDDYNPMGMICLMQFDDAKLSLAASQRTELDVTKEERIAAYLSTKAYNIIDRVDTEDYSFLYINYHTTHGGSQGLFYIREDGFYREFADTFDSVSLHGQKRFDHLIIDKEKEQVTFRYDEDYIIDLKTGKMDKAN